MMAYRKRRPPTKILFDKAELEKLQKPPEGEFTDF